MHVKQAGYIITVIGLFGLTFSLGAVISELDSGSVHAGQLLGVGISVIISLIGVVLIIADRSARFDLNELKQSFLVFVSDVPVGYWIITGFLITYFLFFVFPMFLNSSNRFQYFSEYIPAGNPIGMDIRSIHSLVRDWLVLGQYHYSDGGVWYPPFYNIFFAPLALLGEHLAYLAITFVNILSYLFLVLVIPKIIVRPKDHSLLLLFFATGLISYGFQFELERGQYNVMVFLFCLLAVYIFHYHEKFRYFAYLLFTLAVQLKIYPAIFVVLFIKDWRDWKNNLKRLISLGLINFAALFILGYKVFIDFVRVVMFRSFGQPMDWIGNHSIKSFVNFLGYNKFSLLNGGGLLWVQEHTFALEMLLLIYFMLCFLTIIGVAYWRRENGLNTYLLLACTIGMLIIPSVSHDYKLALLAAPMSIALGDLALPTQTFNKMFSYFLVLVTSIAYSATLYPYKYRPGLIANSAPLLFVILTGITLLYLLKPIVNQASVIPPELKS